MVGKAISYPMILLLETMAWGCTHIDQPPQNNDDLIIKLDISLNSDNASSETAGTDINSLENRLVAERITICLYDAETGDQLITLYDGNNTTDLQNSEGGPDSWFRFSIPESIPVRYKKLGIAVYQRPATSNNEGYIYENLNANMTEFTFDYRDESIHSSMWTDNESQTTCFPAFGYKEVDPKKISGDETIKIDLIRALAKVEISAVDGILIESANVVKSPETSRLLPALSQNLNEYSGTPNVENSPLSNCEIKFVKNTVGDYVAYLPEISAEQLNVDRGLFSVKVNNKDYTLKFTNYIDGEPQINPDPSTGYSCVLRNSLYEFEILGVENEDTNGKLTVKAGVKPWIKHNFIIPI